MDITKKCTKCGIEKPLESFRNQSSTKDKKKYTCAICDDAVQKSRYQQKKEEIKAQVIEWQKKNPDKVAGYRKKWLEKKDGGEV